MAGFFYGFGISLTHLAMLIGTIFVKLPDFEKAKEHD